MKIRTKIFLINICVVILAVMVLGCLWYPYFYEKEGLTGLELFVGSVFAVGVFSVLARMALLEFFVLGGLDELNAETGRLKASVTNLSLGLIMTDHRSNLVIINKRAREILDGKKSPDQKHRWTIAEITERLSKNFNLTEQLEKSLKHHQSAEYADVAYGEHILRVLVSPVLPARADSGCVILLEDITEQKILERTRDEFFSIASHELRTPLTAIRGNAALLQQYFGDSVKDRMYSEMLDDIHLSSIRLIGIVNDFLDASRLEQGKIKLKTESFDLMEVLETVAYETSSLAREKGNHIVIDKTLKTMPQIYADKDRIKQVVYNLVGNAMKFTEKGTITVTAHAQAGMLKVFVADTGPGMSEADQQLLFRKFQQAGTNPFTRETSRGSGLGLYISKLLVERMGGKIALDHSELGKGSTFSFTIPLANSPASATA